MIKMQLNVSQGSGMTYSQMMQSMDSIHCTQVITQIFENEITKKRTNYHYSDFLQKYLKICYFSSLVKEASWISLQDQWVMR